MGVALPTALLLYGNLSMDAEPNLQACDRCHRRKTKCDKRRPTCFACDKAETLCAYRQRPKDPVPRREYVERLEQRARQLEINNRRLEEQIASAGRESSPGSNQPFRQPPSNVPLVQSAGISRGRCEVANEVTFLSTNAAGDRQFLGSASGLFLAGLVRAPHQQADAKLVEEESQPCSTTNWGPDHRTLPPQQLTQSLIDAYLAHDALCYPILPPTRIYIAIDAVYGEQRSTTIRPFDAFLFNMVLAIATAQLYKFNWQVLPDAETHHQRAMAYLNSVLGSGGIESLQAILLCCQYRLGSSSKDASGSLWHLVGIASRMCYELGLHRESSYALQQMGDGAQPAASESQESRRRCFWCVFCLDRVVSITLGRPLAIQMEDFDVELPSVLFGDEMPGLHSATGNPSSLRIATNYRTAVFQNIIKYRGLCGKILTTLHRGNQPAFASNDERHARRQALNIELEAWRADTSLLNLPEMDLSTPLAEARSSFRSSAWFELLYHNAVLLLYRPSSSAISAEDPDDIESIRKIYSAAKQSITLYAYLFKSRKINFSWITLHAVFLAGLSYVYALSQHLREKRKQRHGRANLSSRTLLQDSSIADIVKDTRACSQVLVAVSERCNVPRNCHEVFDRLSDALLADAVEVDAVLHHSLQTCNTSVATSGVENQIPVEADPFIPAASSRRRVAELDPLLTVDSTLVDCIPDLRYMSNAPWGDNAIFQLSMDWLDALDMNNEFEVPADGLNTL